MKKLSSLLTAFAAVAGWVVACYWRERSDWASSADVTQLLVDVTMDAFNEPEPEAVEGADFDPKAAYGYASVQIVRAITPPVAAFPWYAAMASTDFGVEEVTGLRIVETHDGWFPSKQAAHEGIVGWSLPSPRIDGEVEF